MAAEPGSGPVGVGARPSAAEAAVAVAVEATTMAVVATTMAVVATTMAVVAATMAVVPGLDRGQSVPLPPALPRTVRFRRIQPNRKGRRSQRLI